MKIIALYTFEFCGLPDVVSVQRTSLQTPKGLTAFVDFGADFLSVFGSNRLI